MIIVITCVVAIAVIAFILGVRPQDLPEPEPESPFAHLDERKAAVYENLRDLQFEYRVGKLSDQDYQTTKKDLQRELAAVLAEVDKLKARLAGGKPPQPAKAVPAAAPDGAPTAAEPAAKPPAEAPSAPAAGAALAAAHSNGFVCQSCGAQFETSLKFCGECGKPMKVSK